jgi:L-rhamnose-H+ transport protein
MINIIWVLTISLLAGFMVGTFALPTKIMKSWEEENIWFLFPIIAFLILPWLTIIFFVPHWYELIINLPSSVFFGMMFGGLMFGCGMFFFSLAFSYVGIGISFVVNISIGTAGGAIVPIFWHPEEIGSLYSILQIVGVIIFILAVIFSSIAGSDRDKNKAGTEDTENNNVKRNLFIGVLFSFLAGVGSAFQGASYGVANGIVSEIAKGLSIPVIPSSFVAWGFIFGFSAFPYSIFFLIKMIKKKTYTKYSKESLFSYSWLIVLMSILYWGGLVCFCLASVKIGTELASTIVWPIFMVFIILSSIFWSVYSGEWKNAGKGAIKKLVFCIVLFCLAVIVFASNSAIQNSDKKIVKKPITIVKASNNTLKNNS